MLMCKLYGHNDFVPENPFRSDKNWKFCKETFIAKLCKNECNNWKSLKIIAGGMFIIDQKGERKIKQYPKLPKNPWKYRQTGRKIGLPTDFITLPKIRLLNESAIFFSYPKNIKNEFFVLFLILMRMPFIVYKKV